VPSEEYVTSGAPAAFLAAVAQKADELVRAAEALFLDGTTYQGAGEPMRYIDVAGGLITYYVVPRLELVAVCQVTPPVAPDAP
jgi:hypothetical protein